MLKEKPLTINLQAEEISEKHSNKSERKVPLSDNEIHEISKYHYLGIDAIDDYNKFTIRLDKLFSKLTTPDQVEFAKKLIKTGHFDNLPIPEVMGKCYYGSLLDKTESLINIYKNNPELALKILEEQILGFHGTQSGALFGILQHGALLSASESISIENNLVSGERTFSKPGGQRVISFADFRYPDSVIAYSGEEARPQSIDDLISRVRTLRDYLSKLSQKIEQSGKKIEDNKLYFNVNQQIKDLLKTIEKVQNEPDSLYSKLVLGNYPIAFGISSNGFDIKETIYDVKDQDAECVVARIPSDIDGEFVYRGNRLDLSKIKVILTVPEKVEELKEILKNHGHGDIFVTELKDIK